MVVLPIRQCANPNNCMKWLKDTCSRYKRDGQIYSNWLLGENNDSLDYTLAELTQLLQEKRLPPPQCVIDALDRSIQCRITVDNFFLHKFGKDDVNATKHRFYTDKMKLWKTIISKNSTQPVVTVEGSAAQTKPEPLSLTLAALVLQRLDQYLETALNYKDQFWAGKMNISELASCKSARL